MNVLLIDDDRELVEMLLFAFRRAGLTTTTAHDVASGLARFEQDRPDLVVLDLHLGASNGFDFLKEVRGRSQVPIIILTALASEDEKVKGLSLGADDYVTKPFSHRELIARVQMRLRHTGQAAPQPLPNVLHVADIELDANAHTVTRAGRPINLTVTEFRLLHHLLVNAGQVMPTEIILRHVWGNPDPTDSDVLRVTLHRLRRKLGESSANGILRTVAGVGVVLQGERVASPEVPTDDAVPAASVDPPIAASEPVVPLPVATIAPTAPQRDQPPAPTAPHRDQLPAPALARTSGGRVERDGQDRMRLRFRPDAEVESVLFLMSSATLESYDAATDEVTWTMPARGERVWDVVDVARRRGFAFADDVDVPAVVARPALSAVPAPVEAAVKSATAPEASPEPPARAPERRSKLAAAARAGAERAAGGLERVASAATAARASSRAAVDAPAPAPTPAPAPAPSIAPAPARPRPQAAAAPTAIPAPARPGLRARLGELGTGMSASGRTAAMLLGVTLIAALVSIVAEVVRLRLLAELEQVGEISAAVYQQSEARLLLLAFTLLVAYVASAVAFLAWIQRSYTRLRARGISGLRYTPITAVIWFLVPVAFLMVPRRVVSELWRASAVPAGGRVERRTHVPMLVTVWWTVFLAFVLSALLTSAATAHPTITDLFRQTWTNVASDLLAVAAAALAILVIATIELRQRTS